MTNDEIMGCIKELGKLYDLFTTACVETFDDLEAQVFYAACKDASDLKLVLLSLIRRRKNPNKDQEGDILLSALRQSFKEMYNDD